MAAPLLFSVLWLSGVIQGCTRGEKILPFVYILVNDTLYFFYVDDNNELANECIAELKDFGFDFNKLTKVSNKDILNGVLNNKSYFCINGDYLYYERN